MAISTGRKDVDSMADSIHKVRENLDELRGLDQPAIRNQRVSRADGEKLVLFSGSQQAALSHRPAGVCMANYLMTIGLLQAAGEMALRCPKDFGLVSFDDPRLGVLHPKLTTVELPKHQLGSEAAELLIERIAGSSKKAMVRRLQPELCIRESCGFALRARASAIRRV